MHHRKGKARKVALPIIGWREWVAFPMLDIPKVKAKIDTGARSSSLHAFDISEFRRNNVVWLRFSVNPFQHSTAEFVVCEAPLQEYRRIKSSSGHVAVRPVISTFLMLGPSTWPIELSLSSRDEMGFRLLIGRQALQNRFVVDSGSSFNSVQQPRV